MGRTHATSGAVAFLALVPPLRSAGVEVGGVGVAVGAIAAAGAAMLPDLDHPGASMSRALGPITGLLARLVGFLSGGHRQGTHSILGVAVAVAVSVGVILAGDVAVGLGLAFLASLALTALRVKFFKMTAVHTILCLIVGVALTSLSIWDWVPVWSLPWAVGIGVMAHIVGDCLTKEGCPLLWPLPWRLAVLPLTTHGTIERLIIGPGLGVVAVILIWQLSDSSALAPVRQLAQAV